MLVTRKSFEVSPRNGDWELLQYRAPGFGHLRDDVSSRQVWLQFDIATPSKDAVAIEEWVFPLAKGYENELHPIQQKLQAQLDAPIKLSEVSADLAPYAGIVFLGGQGKTIEQPKFKQIAAVLRTDRTRLVVWRL